MKVTDFFSHCWKAVSVLWMQDSIISHAMSLRRCSRCWRNSASGQWRSRMKDWRASSFQNRSSDVAQPLLQPQTRKAFTRKETFTLWFPSVPSRSPYEWIGLSRIPLDPRNAPQEEQTCPGGVDGSVHFLNCLKEMLWLSWNGWCWYLPSVLR